jgi:hypothetical protein
LGSSSSTITFSSIPATYTDLVLILSSLTGDDLANFTLRYNSDSASNYSAISLEGNGSNPVSQRQSNQSQMYFVGFQAGTYTEPFISILQIMNYSNTTNFKTTLTRSASNAASAYAGLWRNTAAINTVALTNVSSTFSANTTATLYGIKAA